MSAGAAMASQIRTTDSSSWGFFDLDTNDTNASFFDDSFTYIEQEPTRGISTSTKLILFIFVGLVLIAGGVLTVLRLNNNNEYQNLNNIATIYDTSTTTNYAEGVEASADSVVQLDSIMQNYKSSIHSSTFNTLSNVCLNSQLGQTYTNTKNGIQTIYDQNDGFVRIYDKMFRSFDYEIDKVIYNEDTDTYYCYVNITAPNTMDATSYIQSNSYLITKFFNNNEITSANIINCLDNHVFPSSEITPSVNTICFEATIDNNGNMMLLSDTPLYSLYNNTYTQLLNTTLSFIKNGTVVGN